MADGDRPVAHLIDNPRSNNLDLGAEWYFTEKAVLGVALFYKDIDSFITFPTTQAPGHVRCCRSRSGSDRAAAAGSGTRWPRRHGQPGRSLRGHQDRRPGLAVERAQQHRDERLRRPAAVVERRFRRHAGARAARRRSFAVSFVRSTRFFCSSPSLCTCNASVASRSPRLPGRCSSSTLPPTSEASSAAGCRHSSSAAAGPGRAPASPRWCSSRPGSRSRRSA